MSLVGTLIGREIETPETVSVFIILHAIHAMPITTDFQFAQIEMSGIKWVRTERTIESFVADHAYEQTFGKLTLEEMILDFGSKSAADCECFHFYTSDGEFGWGACDTLI